MFEIWYVIGFTFEKQVRGFGESVSVVSTKHFFQYETTTITATTTQIEDFYSASYMPHPV